jgi:5-methylcytosine-specific restriction protein A
MAKASEAEGIGDWSPVELEAAVVAYLEMLQLELLGQKYVKSHQNQRLRENELSTRSPGSVEMRMQNISAVMMELRLPYIQGYLPKGQVGSRVKPILIEAIERHSGNMPWAATSDLMTLDERVEILLLQPLVEIPPGNLNPKRSISQTAVFDRSPAVKAWVLKHAGPYCEGCHSVAPFEVRPGIPYLEVHHVIPLAENGADTVENSIALCPNCHRRCHFSHARAEFIRELYYKVPRLLPRPEADEHFGELI